MSGARQAEDLADSFRQSRREMAVMLGTWLAFFLWTGIACTLLAYWEPGEPVARLFGMPRWAFVGVALPWLAANGFIAWFALRFMKDTDLDPGKSGAEPDTSEPDSPEA